MNKLEKLYKNIYEIQYIKPEGVIIFFVYVWDLHDFVLSMKDFFKGDEDEPNSHILGNTMMNIKIDLDRFLEYFDIDEKHFMEYLKDRGWQIRG